VDQGIAVIMYISNAMITRMMVRPSLAS